MITTPPLWIQPVTPLARNGHRQEASAAILGTGRACPDGLLTNADLERMVDTSDEWITRHTGIKRRHRAGPDETTSQLATRAAAEALAQAGVSADDVDLIICATVTPDQLLPATACLVQAELGATHAAAFDLAAACAGFLYGVTLADQMIRCGQVRYALVVGADVLTPYVDYNDRNTCVLFGDGAGAALLGAAPPGGGILASRLWSDGRHRDLVHNLGAGTRVRPAAAVADPSAFHFRMNGPELFKMAIRCLTEASLAVLREAGLTTDDVALFVPHQSNQRINDGVMERLGLPHDRVYSNIAYRGNTAAASVPIALDECARAGRIKVDDVVLLAAIGGGVAWAATVLRWGTQVSAQ